MAGANKKTPREKSKGLAGIEKLARKLDPEPPHVFQVRKNAELLFDATRPLHKRGKRDRRLLAAAALLHDIGHTIDEASHHKHSRDLIVQTDLPGMSKRERNVVACIARYHRKAHPDPRHAVYKDLKKSDQKRVSELAGLLRIADGLDRAHAASCKRINATLSGNVVLLHVEQRRPSPVDVWGAQRKRDLFEEAFGVRVVIEATVKPRRNPS